MLRYFGVRSLRVFAFVSLLANSLLLVKVFYADCNESPFPFLPIIADTQHEAPAPIKAVNTQLPVKASPSSSSSSSSPSSSQLQQVIFVGGVPRSGTTLARAMLDSHPDIRCGEETRVIPRILAMRSRWDRSEKEHKRLIEAGLSGNALDLATRAFITSIILGHGEPAKYLCNKDPLVLNYMNDVVRLYPKSKFILMIRDGRAVANSIFSRNVTITGVDSKSYMSAALFWNKLTTRMTSVCYSLSKQRCIIVRYEELVRAPEENMRRVLEFVNVPWHENVLHHHLLINKEVSLSRYVW